MKPATVASWSRYTRQSVRNTRFEQTKNTSDHPRSLNGAGSRRVEPLGKETRHGSRKHETVVGGRRSLRSSNQSLEPENATVHSRRPFRDLHH